MESCAMFSGKFLTLQKLLKKALVRKVPEGTEGMRGMSLARADRNAVVYMDANALTWPFSIPLTRENKTMHPTSISIEGRFYGFCLSSLSRFLTANHLVMLR